MFFDFDPMTVLNRHPINVATEALSQAGEDPSAIASAVSQLATAVEEACAAGPSGVQEASAVALKAGSLREVIKVLKALSKQEGASAQALLVRGWVGGGAAGRLAASRGNDLALARLTNQSGSWPHGQRTSAHNTTPTQCSRASSWPSASWLIVAYICVRLAGLLHFFEASALTARSLVHGMQPGLQLAKRLMAGSLDIRDTFDDFYGPELVLDLHKAFLSDLDFQVRAVGCGGIDRWVTAAILSP